MKKSDSSKPGSKGESYERALQRAAGLCSRQEQCTGNIREKLIGWNVDSDEAEKIISVLTREKFLDDERYAGFYVKDKFKFNAWGSIRISHMLRQKGVDQSFIESALKQIDQEEWFGSCLDLVRKKAAKLKDKDPFIRKGKLLRYAAGRGFEAELAYRVLDQLEKE